MIVYRIIETKNRMDVFLSVCFVPLYRRWMEADDLYTTHHLPHAAINWQYTWHHRRTGCYWLWHLFQKIWILIYPHSFCIAHECHIPLCVTQCMVVTKPIVDVMDAGLRDNTDGNHTSFFMCSEWIQNNTSGVVYIQIRDRKRRMEGRPERAQHQWYIIQTCYHTSI